MTYSRQDIRINTKITDVEQLKIIASPVIEFANKHNIHFNMGFDANNYLVVTSEVTGLTSAYCKGMVAEIKQMLKDAFMCKLDVIFYAY